ncbi:hypothetical protein [Paremcibacter congregatus]|uniref:Uncharacterized protein n=1 Tax=Paremcibacter congregatus TaxID=2043170 RepID=A0A2G4YWW0_9PROT|nr:hypothetical protein [Paremcibacter congregatus]PHZ86710.1 hypothetical protein CRD36_00200 [Paremcibacter congregatus]QDE27604.1 hypothetical protein FIV45_10095 [Paremcibacter congregatus]
MSQIYPIPPNRKTANGRAVESVTADDSLKPAMVKEALEVWQPRSKRPLSEEDAREIIENTTGFFKLLHKWKRAETLENKIDKEKD